MNSESSKVLTSAPKSSLLLFISLPELDGIELYNFEMQLANPGMLTAQSLGLSLSLSLSPSLSPSLSCIKKSMLQNLIFLVCYVYVGIKISGDVIAA
jgi:hypothetical protein